MPDLLSSKLILPAQTTLKVSSSTNINLPSSGILSNVAIGISSLHDISISPISLSSSSFLTTLWFEPKSNADLTLDTVTLVI